MTHTPTIIDIKTDLRRGIMASLSKDEFNDPNFKVFLENAQKSIELLKEKIGIRKYNEVRDRISKSLDSTNSNEKRREDLLIASCLV